MGMRELEAEILVEAREVTKNAKLKMKDIQEWRTGKIKLAQEGEKDYYLKKSHISIAVKVK